MQKEISRNLCSPDLQIQITKMMTASLTCKNLDGQIDPSHVFYMFPPEIFGIITFPKHVPLCSISEKVIASVLTMPFSEGVCRLHGRFHLWGGKCTCRRLEETGSLQRCNATTTAPGMTANKQASKQEITKRKAKRNNSKNTNNNKNSKNKDKEQK